MGHRTVGGTAARPWWHAMIGVLVGALVVGWSGQSGGQILSRLLPVGLLEVVFGRTFKMGRDLHEREVSLNITTDMLD